MMLLEEMASIFVTPYLLIFVVPRVKLVAALKTCLVKVICKSSKCVSTDSQHVDDILQFISNFTVYVDGVGDVCRLVFVLCSFFSHQNQFFLIIIHVCWFYYFSNVALVCSTFKAMEIGSMVLRLTQKDISGVPRENWRNHF